MLGGIKWDNVVCGDVRYSYVGYKDLKRRKNMYNIYDVKSIKQALINKVISSGNLRDDTRDPLPVIDPEIAEYVAIVNKTRDFATTQSCAGHSAEDILARQSWIGDCPPFDDNGYITFASHKLIPPDILIRFAHRIEYDFDILWFVTLYFEKGWPPIEAWKSFWQQFPQDDKFPYQQFIDIIRESGKKHPRWLKGAYERCGLYCAANAKYLRWGKDDE